MNDPHVKALHYRVIVGEDIDYDNAPPVSGITDEFDLSIDGDIAIFEMKKHYPATDEAKEIVENIYVHGIYGLVWSMILMTCVSSLIVQMSLIDHLIKLKKIQ